MSLRTWYHVAVTRSGNTLRIFINGTLEDSYTTSVAIDDGTINRIDIGGNGGGSNFIGYIDEARITKGVARYTSNFTPQTKEFYPGDYVSSGTTNIADGNWHQVYATYEKEEAAVDTYYPNVTLLLHMNGTDGSSTFTDSSSANNVPTNYNVSIETEQYKFGGSSAYFDGNDYLSYADSDQWHFGSGDFTIEAWVKTPGQGSNIYSMIASQSNAAASSNTQFYVSLLPNDYSTP